MSRCSSCPHIRPPVPSSGPSPCRVLFLAEQPARDEDHLHYPLAGRTGKEFDNTYLPLTGLPRSEVHVTNARLCSHKDYHNPTPSEAIDCASMHLGPLLSKLKPEVIVPMGSVACSLWPEINLTLQHGLPLEGKWGSWSGALFPMFHPSAGLHATGYMIALQSDFAALGKYLQGHSSPEGCWSIPDGLEDYQVIRTEYDLDRYLHDYLNSVVAEDTESLPDGSPYCLTFSLLPGTSRLIYARDTRLVTRYRNIFGAHTCLDRIHFHHIFHNYLHDVIPFSQLSIPIDRFTDTMILAYNLCLGGGGDEDDEAYAARGSLSLKSLAYRHLSMTMTSFQDTVRPHSVPRLLDWLRLGESVLKPQKRKKGDLLTDEDKHHVSVHRKVSRLLKDYDKPDSAVDPWDRVDNWHNADRDLLESFLGPLPKLNVSDLPEPDLLAYSCRDSDATLRLYHFLQHRKHAPWLFFTK